MYRVVRIKSCVFFTLGLLSIIGCGREEDSQIFAADPEKKPLFIVMGGNVSCGRDDAGRDPSPFASGLYQAFVEHISLQREVDYVASCYTDRADVYYALSSDPATIIRAQRTEFETHMLGELGKASQGIAIGHSYGGWLAMKLGEAVVASGRAVPFSGLATVDPISREHCSFGSPSGCRAAPQDFSDPERQDLADITDYWLNLYQNVTWYLHSSPMTQADQNVELDLSHGEIEEAASTWDLVNDLVARIE